MAEYYFKVSVPEGDVCNGCNHLLEGTILCQLWDEICSEDYNEERFSRIIKHKKCLNAIPGETKCVECGVKIPDNIGSFCGGCDY